MSQLRAALIAAALAGSVTAAAAQNAKAAHAGVPVVHAARAAGAIQVDGHLDEQAWQQATPVTTFTQRDPAEGKPATERTELRVLFDDDALYVGARMFDREAGRIARQLARRDQPAEADSFVLFLDPHHDHLTGVMFEVSAAGVQSDATLYNDSSFDRSWDGVWDSAVSIDHDGWAVELKIPYSQLRFAPAERHTFGINVMRYIQRKKEEDWLVQVPKSDSAVVSRFAHLEDLTGISPHRSVELLPHVLSRGEFIRPPGPNDPFNHGARAFEHGGLDLKYRLSSNLSLDGAINPDFGQVEVDPAVVNLTAFETFFQEKRPFFIEGSSLFGSFGQGGAHNSWGFNRSEPLIFYSRRVGRAPEGDATGDFVDRPGSSAILGAAKLTGRTANGWSMAILEAVTAREWARTSTNGVEDRTEIAEPTNYFVARAQREIGRRAAAGFIATAVDRGLRAPALRDLLTSHAYVGGADGYYFLDSKLDWVVNGRIAASYAGGSTASILHLQEAPQRYYQRPDAFRLNAAATSLGGWTGSINLNRNNGVHGLNVALWGVSPGFESGDAGFDFMSDRAGAHVVYQYHDTKVNRFKREIVMVAAKWYTWNFEHERQGDGIHFFNDVELKNYWHAFLGGLFFRRVQDDRGTRGGPSMASPAVRGLFGDMSSDSRRRARVSVRSEFIQDTAGGSYRSIAVNGRYIPSAALEISLGPRYGRGHTLAQYVGTFADSVVLATAGSRYVFSTLEQREFSLETRVNYVLSPRASFQIYMQPLMSAGDYKDFKQLAAPRTFDFVHYTFDNGALHYDPSAARYTVDPGDGGSSFQFADPNFNLKSLRLNAIYRWEWKRGSAFYAVWTQQRQDLGYPGQFALGRDFRRTFSAPADNVLLVKIAYWFQR